MGQLDKNSVNFSDNEILFAREYWAGDSRDGHIVNGDGYHYYLLTKQGKILEAFEYYEKEDGTSVVSPLPEMLNIDWLQDLGFEDFEVLDMIPEHEYFRIKELLHEPRT